jgi:glutamate carboxypeptidase
MPGLREDEEAVLEPAAAEPMLDQVQGWAKVNSGSRNLSGLAEMARIYADAFAALPASSASRMRHRPKPWRPTGYYSHWSMAETCTSRSGRRPPSSFFSPATWTRSTVPIIPFQDLAWREPGVLAGPGVADMKGGIAVMLAALKGRGEIRGGAEPRLRSGDQQRRGSRLPGVRRLIAAAARGRRRR